MNSIDWVFWTIVSLTLNNYLLLVLIRKWPQLKFRTYVMNVAAISMCAYSLMLAQPNIVWIGALLLNLAFQNVLLVHPKGTNYRGED